MKESIWGYAILTLGILAIGVIWFFANTTRTDQHNYNLLKETTEAAMMDAVDLAYYRQTGLVRIEEEKFVENFIRRFAENADLSNKYVIEIYDVNEIPPKVSLKVSSSKETTATGEVVKFDMVNNIDAILETTYFAEKICTPVSSSSLGKVPEGKFVAGDEYMCTVAPGVTYKFYVLGKEKDVSGKTTGNINLILDSNICSDGTVNGTNCQVKWISESDLKSWIEKNGAPVGVDVSYHSLHTLHNVGPVTALNHLYSATDNWSNVKKVGSIRLPNFSDINTSDTCKIFNYAGDGSTSSCAKWLVNNLDVTDAGKYLGGINGITENKAYWSYWLSNPDGMYSSSSKAGAGVVSGYLGRAGSYSIDNGVSGVRPVIVIPTINIET